MVFEDDEKLSHLYAIATATLRVKYVRDDVKNRTAVRRSQSGLASHLS